VSSFSVALLDTCRRLSAARHPAPLPPLLPQHPQEHRVVDMHPVPRPHQPRVRLALAPSVPAHRPRLEHEPRAATPAVAVDDERPRGILGQQRVDRIDRIGKRRARSSGLRAGTRTARRGRHRRRSRRWRRSRVGFRWRGGPALVLFVRISIRERRLRETLMGTLRARAIKEPARRHDKSDRSPTSLNIPRPGLLRALRLR